VRREVARVAAGEDSARNDPIMPRCEATLIGCWPIMLMQTRGKSTGTKKG
jgi:hypothetical protein